MNKHRALLLKALEQLLDAVRAGKGFNHNVGICANLMSITPQIDLGLAREMKATCRILRPIWQDWEHYSGERDYPIPGGESKYYDHWRGVGLSFRIELMEFLIAKLQDDAAENYEYTRSLYEDTFTSSAGGVGP